MELPKIIAPKGKRKWNVIFFAIEVACFVPALWWIPYSHLPAPGYGIALLAFGAALLSVHDSMTQIQRSGWLLLMVILLPVEMRAIAKDRWDIQTAQQRDREEERLQFSQVLTAAKNDFANLSEQDEKHFADTTKSFQNIQKSEHRQFVGLLNTTNQVEHLSQANLDVMAGSGSYPCVVPQQEHPSRSAPTLDLELSVVGKNSLTISAEEFRLSRYDHHSEWKQTIGTVSPGYNVPLNPIHPMFDQNRQADYILQIVTQNGFYEETINVNGSPPDKWKITYAEASNHEQPCSSTGS